MNLADLPIEILEKISNFLDFDSFRNLIEVFPALENFKKRYSGFIEIHKKYDFDEYSEIYPNAKFVVYIANRYFNNVEILKKYHTLDLSHCKYSYARFKLLSKYHRCFNAWQCLFS